MSTTTKVMTNESSKVATKKVSKDTAEDVLKEISTINFEVLRKDELDTYGEKVATAIMEKIHESSERIATAKRKSKDAEKMEINFLGFGTSKKAEATSEALVATNEAVHEMNELMRALIVYTQLNGKLSKAMNSAMARMMAEGFKNHGGDIVELNKNGEEFAQIVMQEAEDFANKQLQIELLQQKHSDELRSVDQGSKQRAQEIENKIHILKQKTEDHVVEIRSELSSKIDSSMSRSDENDALHQRLIDDLQKTTETINRESVEQDKIHTNQILALNKELKKQKVIIEELQKHAEASALHRYLAIGSLIVSLAAIACSAWLYSTIQ
ncbi:hypothetical protein ACQUQU_08140 [Thalassolituus sp. LLYu03]|uniref:hypothetical protein n=1 Tax=Thalassolituus sp. LLYu03 TaxID=3421656 RepID=UPI003D29EB74